MAYIPHTAADTEEMLRSIGVSSIDELFKDIPEDLILDEPIDLKAKSEFEVSQYFEERASENRTFPDGKAFLGAGAYRHFIPAAAKYLISRGEFMTCYTPYQAEVSQGTLQAIFEFQSHICALTGLDSANASMYDGATALAEALTMAMRLKRKKVVYLPELLHPDYRNVCETFLKELDVEIKYLTSKGARTVFEKVDDGSDVAAVVVNTPNCLGGIDDGYEARKLTDELGAVLIAVVNPTSLSVLASPGDYGADIAVGESQPLGIPVSFGGPYAGFFACNKKLIRKMPGRIVGKTRDSEGTEGYVLTLQTREQHIRRDKATSNICTNQGLFALLTTIYMTLIGKEGLIEVAETSLVQTRKLAKGLIEEGVGKLLDEETPYFHEVAIELPIDAEVFCRAMKNEHGILAGLALGRWDAKYRNMILINCTEVHLDKDIAAYIEAAKKTISNLAKTAAGTATS